MIDNKNWYFYSSTNFLLNFDHKGRGRGRTPSKSATDLLKTMEWYMNNVFTYVEYHFEGQTERKWGEQTIWSIYLIDIPNYNW